jgi:hypothetical protein
MRLVNSTQRCNRWAFLLCSQVSGLARGYARSEQRPGRGCRGWSGKTTDRPRATAVRKPPEVGGAGPERRPAGLRTPGAGRGHSGRPGPDPVTRDRQGGGRVGPIGTLASLDDHVRRSRSPDVEVITGAVRAGNDHGCRGCDGAVSALLPPRPTWPAATRPTWPAATRPTWQGRTGSPERPGTARAR